MIIEEWGGIIGFVVALVFSVSVRRVILHSKSRNISPDELLYRDHVIQAIRPNCSDVSFDEVAEALKREDFGGFSLAEYRDVSFEK